MKIELNLMKMSVKHQENAIIKRVMDLVVVIRDIYTFPAQKVIFMQNLFCL